MCQCEDRPCCGHLAEERASDAYWAERAYHEDDEFYPESDEDEDDESERVWATEDAALEASLFGDC